MLVAHEAASPTKVDIGEITGDQGSQDSLILEVPGLGIGDAMTTAPMKQTVG
jgi:hypothetical protein